MRVKHVQKPFWNECILHAFWVTFWKQVWKKITCKERRFYAIFILVNACKTRAKTVLKWMHFACVLNQFWNQCILHAFLRHFVSQLKKKNHAKNYVFVSNFHFGKGQQKNTGKNRLKWMHFACVLRHFVETFEKHVLKTAVFWANFTSVNACKTRAITILKLMHFACFWDTLSRQIKKKKTC